jgi:hypothetical protein
MGTIGRIAAFRLNSWVDSFLFFLYCYFAFYIGVLTLKIDHYLVFISIKLSYLILSNVRFVLDQYALLHEYSANSLKQQCG